MRSHGPDEPPGAEADSPTPAWLPGVSRIQRRPARSLSPGSLLSSFPALDSQKAQNVRTGRDPRGHLVPVDMGETESPHGDGLAQDNRMHRLCLPVTRPETLLDILQNFVDGPACIF